MNVRNTINARQSRKLSDGMEQYKQQPPSSSRILIGDPPQGPPGSGSRSRGGVQGSQSSTPKISISDAIGLITLRIGRLEEIASTNSKPINNTPESSVDDTNTLIKSLIARINAIEDPSSVRDHIPDPEGPTTSSCTYEGICNELVEDVANMKTDIEDLRKLIIKIQASI